MAVPGNLVFAYGTLMTGESRHWLFQPGRVKSVRRASVSGRLLDLGEYPGLVLSPGGESRVCGELIDLEALDAVIDAIDGEEGPDFRRETVQVTLNNGATHLAWAWIFASDSCDAPVIPSGDWRNRGPQAADG